MEACSMWWQLGEKVTIKRLFFSSDHYSLVNETFVKGENGIFEMNFKIITLYAYNKFTFKSLFFNLWIRIVRLTFIKALEESVFA